MSILADFEIKKLALESKMIDNFVEKNTRINEKNEKVLSYGLSSYGYDPRANEDFKVFTNVNNAIIDPKNFDKNAVVDKYGEFCIIPPNSFAMCSTIEYFRIPRDILVICLGKSTYARCGIIVNVTPIEPEFEGHVVIEFSNTTNLPVKIYANEGCCQFVFMKANQICNESYMDKKGKYQGQKGVRLPEV